MSIRLIALDLDGTLLTTDKRMTDDTLSMLEKAAAQGIHIVPATGRSVTGLAPEVRDLPFVQYVITANGAAVWDVKKNKLISKRAFSTEQAVELWKFICAYGTMLDSCIDGVARMPENYYDHIEDYMQDEPRCRLIKTTRIPTENMSSWIADTDRTVEKFNLFFNPAREADRIKAREELKQFPYISVTSSLGNNLEINHMEATKGKGLMALAGYLGLKRDEIMACGDGENDISMLEAAGIGVAMENAPSIVKESADVITLTNDQNGVAYAIRKWAVGESKEDI